MVYLVTKVKKLIGNVLVVIVCERCLQLLRSIGLGSPVLSQMPLNHEILRLQMLQYNFAKVVVNEFQE